MYFILTTKSALYYVSLFAPLPTQSGQVDTFVNYSIYIYAQNQILRRKTKAKAVETHYGKSHPYLFAIFTFLLLSIHSSSSSSSSSNPSRNPNPNPNLNSAYDELKNKGFPIGLLPTNVLNYSLNRTSGDFSVNLDDICRITLPPDNYLAAYSRRVTGKLVEGKISELNGIQVRAFFQWWSITGIRMSGENLVFEVGMVTAKYPSNNFDDSLECEGRHSSS